MGRSGSRPDRYHFQLLRIGDLIDLCRFRWWFRRRIRLWFGRDLRLWILHRRNWWGRFLRLLLLLEPHHQIPDGDRFLLLRNQEGHQHQQQGTVQHHRCHHRREGIGRGVLDLSLERSDPVGGDGGARLSLPKSTSPGWWRHLAGGERGARRLLASAGALADLPISAANLPLWGPGSSLGSGWRGRFSDPAGSRGVPGAEYAKQPAEAGSQPIQLFLEDLTQESTQPRLLSRFCTARRCRRTHPEGKW